MSRHRYYRPELDVLRCFAFLAVYLHHTAFSSPPWLHTLRFAGGFGVCLFFLLSAFLITELLDREVESTGTVKLRAFYARRILRIWPLYFAILFADFLHQKVLGDGSFTPGRLIASLLLAGNWFVASHGFLFSWSMPLWSISVEEQFYLLWPPVRRFAGRSGSILFSVSAYLAAYVALAFLCRAHADVETTVWVNSFVQFQFFAAGALLALALKGRVPTFPAWGRLLLVLGGASALYVAQAAFHAKVALGPATLTDLVPGYLLVTTGCVCVILSCLGASAPGRWTFLIYLGKISYGLYAFHYGVLLYTGYLVRVVNHFIPALRPYGFGVRDTRALPITIAIASASYRWFEKPILRYKQRFEVIRTRPS